MASANTTVKVNKLNRNVMLTVTVVTTKQLRLRMWLGTRLIMLGGWVMGCDIRVDDSHRELSPDDYFGAEGGR